MLNTDWPKVKRGKEELSRIISSGGTDMADRLLRLLQSAERAPDYMLPSTGVPLAWERLLSSIFIEGEGYGTRCSSIVLMSHQEIHFTERTYTRGGFHDRQQRILYG